MDCPDWPPPLPSLPPYPPCRPPTPPPKEEVKKLDSRDMELWSDILGPMFKKITDPMCSSRKNTYDLTRNQRREILSIRMPGSQDRLIWSVPLPQNSTDSDAIPMWEKLYVNRQLPMLKCAPEYLKTAGPKIGKKIHQSKCDQGFLLYDPTACEVNFSYENVGDPHLTTYYEGKKIRGFLLNVDTSKDKWSVCSLKRFNSYRKFLKKVHLSLMQYDNRKQDVLKDEIVKLKEYKRITDEIMANLEQKVIMEEMRTSLINSLKQNHANKINKVLASIREKEDRIRKLQEKREIEREYQRQKGLKLLADQELKNKIAMEIKRRKKIATLRRWRDTELKTIKVVKRLADERAKERANKIDIKWRNKIDNVRLMMENQEKYLKIQKEVRKKNVEIRKARTEFLKNKEKEQFNELVKECLKRKELAKKRKSHKRLIRAITRAWLHYNPNQEYDLQTELFRVRKSVRSTMAELLSSPMEGPDRFSIILMSRNRIQQEQRVPLQVSFAIDYLLESVVEEWTNTRIALILDTVVNQVILTGKNDFADIREKYKSMDDSVKKGPARIPRGVILEPDPPEIANKNKKNTKPKEIGEKKQRQLSKNTSKMLQTYSATLKQRANTVVPHYVQFGVVTVHEYQLEEESVTSLKPVHKRPKTPMPTQEQLCRAGFTQERLFDVLPTIQTQATLKGKGEFRKIFKKTACILFKKSMTLVRTALEPTTRRRAVAKLIYLGESERPILVRTWSKLIMNKRGRSVYNSDDFQWLIKAVAREAIKEILNPPEFSKEPKDVVQRTKIMFYTPQSNSESCKNPGGVL